MVYNLDQNSINKIIDIFKDIYLFQSFQYFDLKTEEEKQYTKEKVIHVEPIYDNFLFFSEKIDNKVYHTNILISNLNNIYNFQKKPTKIEEIKNFFCLFFKYLATEDSLFKETIVCLGSIRKESEYTCLKISSSLEDQTFFILSFLFCMLNEGTKNGDKESFTFKCFKKETERIKGILKEVINNRKIEEIEKAIKEAIKEGKNIEDKKTLKKILEPFFKEKSNLKFYLGILFFIFISILILLIFQNFLKNKK